MNGLILVLLFFLLAITIEAVFHLTITGRTLLFWGVIVAALGGFSGHAAVPLLRKLGILRKDSNEDLARAIGNYYPEVEDRLVNTLQLGQPLFTQSAPQQGSPAFAMAAFQMTYGQVRHLNFEAIVDDRPVKRAFLYFLMTVGAFLAVFFSMKTEMSAATNRLIHHRTFFQKPAPFLFQVQPGNVQRMRGDSVHIFVTTTGEQLQQVNLHVREEGQKEFDVIPLSPSPLDTGKNARQGFSYYLRAQHPTEYFAEAREIESETFHVRVLDHPIVRTLSVLVTPPAYTREKARKQDENIGDISGIAGTRGDFTIIASKALRSAAIVFTPLAEQNDSTHAPTLQSNPAAQVRLAQRIPLTIEKDSIAHGSVTFLRSGSYHIDLIDADSVASDHPIEYTVTVSKDEMPTIALIEPNDRADIPSNQRVDMLAKIHDDFGFRGVRLGYRLSKSKFVPEEKEYKWVDVPLANYNTQDLDVPYIWNVTPLQLTPEDEVAYVLEVADNDAVTGPKRARTPEFTIRFPSMKEIFQKAQEQANQADKDLKEIKQDATDLKKKIDEAVDEMKQMKSQDIARSQQDFSKQKDVQQILERQKELNQRVEDVAKQLDEMSKNLDKQQAISPETMKKYDELQQLFKEINNPDIKKAMDKLENAMKNVDPKQMQEAMKNLQFNEENFKKSIERTTNILKKIQMEQKVDELTKRSGELSKQEEKLASEQEKAAQQQQQTGKEQSQEERAAAERQQEDAQKELERMQQEMKDLAKDMQKLPENMQSPEEMKAAQEAMNDPGMQQSMQDAQDAAKQGNNQRSQQRAKDASKKLQNAQQKMRDLKQKMSQTEKQRTLQEMKQIREQINKLSKEEEQIKNQAQQANPQSNVFRELAEKQSEKKDQLGQTASRMMELAQKSTSVTPEMGKSMGQAFSEMQKAQDAMTERDQGQAQQSAQNAMAALNKAAQQTQQAMEGMQKGSQQGGGGEGGEDGEGQSGEGNNPGENGKPGSQGQGSALQQFLNQINKMAAQQQALNDQMNNMMNGQGSAQAQKQAMQQQAQLARMAAQQQAVQKTIEDLAKEQQSAKDGDKLAAKNLQNLADEMQDVVSEMKNRGVSPETVQRQERILSRLLEAQRSTHERDKEEKRESKSGDNVVRESPRDVELNTPEAKKALEDEINHSRESGYSKDYNALIRKYFESLQKAGQKPSEGQ